MDLKEPEVSDDVITSSATTANYFLTYFFFPSFLQASFFPFICVFIFLSLVTIIEAKTWSLKEILKVRQ